MDPSAPKTPAATPDTNTVAVTVPADVYPPPPADFPFLSPPQRPDELGRLGPYRVLGVLGRGGMGAVFRADDPRLKRQLAVKVLLPDLSADPSAVARFRREAQAQAAVEHDHIIPIFEVEEANGAVYLAMPLLKGQTLASALKQDRHPPVAEIVRIGQEVAAGLAAAHERGLIHRDIKPANIWLEDHKRRVKILDFGLARVARDAGDEEPVTLGAIGAARDDVTQLTAAGAVMGTPAYMSPEQARGRALDARSDVFSLGVVLYEMAAGRKPFAGASRFELMAAVVEHSPPGAHEVSPNVPEALGELIARMMAKDPAARPQSCAAVADELDAVARVLAPLPVVVPLPGGPSNPWIELDPTDAIIPTDAPPSDEPRPPRAPARPGPRVWAAVALAVALAGASVGAVVWHFTKPPKELISEPAQVTTSATVPKVVPPDRQRELAAWALARDGTVHLEGVPKPVARPNELPSEPFRVRAVYLGTAGPLSDEDLKRFHGIDTLEVLEFNGGEATDAGLAELLAQPFAARLARLDVAVPKASDAALAGLEKCPKLTSLRLAGGATDAGLEKLPPRLISLQLDNGSIDGKGLAQVRLPALTALALVGCKQVEDGALTAAAFPALAELTLRGTAATDAGYKALAKLKKFGKLTVSGRPVSGPEVAAIAGLDLSALNLSDTKLTDAGVLPLAKVSKLGALSLADNPAVTDAALDSLAGMKFLRTLNLTGTGVTGGGVRKLRAALPQCTVTSHTDQGSDRRAAEWVLTRGGRVIAGNRSVEKLEDLPPAFELTGAYFTLKRPEPGALAALRDADRLTTWVHITGPGFDDAALKELAACGFAPGLDTLTLAGTAVTDAGLAELAKFPRLNALYVTQSAITGTGLGVWRDMPGLIHLCLTNSAITDAGVKALRGAKLTRLALDRTQITDGACEHIATLTGLTSLQIEGTAVTDAGLIGLAPATKLTALEAHRTKVTRDGVARLFEELPFCNIVYDGGATPFNVPPLERARPVLEWVLKIGGVVEIEFSPGGNPRKVEALDKPFPADARLAYLGFGGTAVEMPEVPRGPGGANKRLEALANGLADLPAVAWSPRQATLGLSHGIGTGAGLARLTAVRGLRPVTYLRFSAEDVARYAPHVGAFPRLRGLGFHSCKLSAAALTPLAEVRGLREVYVAGDAPPADALKALAALPLEQLHFSAVALPTDAAGALAGMTTLTRLEFTKTPLPEAAPAKLRAALPKCEIVIDKQPHK